LSALVCPIYFNWGEIRLIVTCPHCGFRQYDKDTKCLYGLQWGSPIKHCPNCNREFFEKEILEAAVVPTPKFPGFPIKLFSFETVALLIGPMCLFYLLFNYGFITLICGIAWTAFSVVSIIGLIIPLIRKKRKYKLLLSESQKRTSDPEYMSKLNCFRGSNL